MNKEHLLSFCCVSYNHAQFIEECIRSIWNQDYKNVEILALDDGSSDNSLEILNKLKEISPCSMAVISQKNTGDVVKNYNKLFNLAKGEYVTTLSPDDKLVENSIGYKMQYLNNNKNCAYTCDSKIIEIDAIGNIKNTLPPMKLASIENPSAEEMLKLEYEEIGAYYIQGTMWRKSVIDAVHGFDEDMICDDIVLRTKVAHYLLEHPELTFKVFYTPGVYYRRHDNNISSNSYRQIKGVADYLQRYWKNSPNPKTYNEWYKHTAYYEPFKTLKLTLSHPRLRNPKYIYLWLFVRYKWCKSNLRKYLIDRGLYKPKAK